MRFLTKTFSAKKSSQVKVTVSQATSVKLMNARNLDKYRKCQTNTYWGGEFSETTIVFTIPGDGQWAIVVEKGTFYTPIEIEASVELVSGGLEATPLPGMDAVLLEESEEKPVDTEEESSTILNEEDSEAKLD